MGNGRVLCFRLSSLGDVVISTAALTVLHTQGKRVDWVTLDAYAGLVEGHPAVDRVWSFSKTQKLKGWLTLLRELADQPYDQVLDLHGSLRTRFARFYFFFHPNGRRMRWRSLPKERWRSWGFYLFKKFWPRSLRPRLQVERFAQTAGGQGHERPDLKHLLKTPPNTRSGICVMPSAKGAGKTWPTERWVALLSSWAVIRERITILGTPADQPSRELLKGLREVNPKLDVRDGLSRMTFQELARVIAESRRMISVDTGMAHLAEALGVPSTVLFGPTSPEQGFGPWRSESQAVHTLLWCSPCGRDGRMCFRPTERFACQNQIQVETVRRAVESPPS
jgi:ADP-heptose:LPS heptosyltransferase